ncbi:SMP-30/gluconolactonase/LRE family protein [Nocardioides sp.]|uniref:SMP-30/gluconolactonase/LRE family protein n=1 Tax=Nocardioides sp. TaxID=35761 RepID=UPI00273378D5|nr:SMP-30/gluconolactonase/LRE family protein [Nocardioides sp.]MDP3894468.1 SMP-30/gluconolactonase/LRE family protein [Nocardioides sp.]
MTFHVHPVPGAGAEDVVVGTSGRHEGAVFTGTDDGSILRLSHDAQRIDRVATTGGRPLGVEIDPDGDLLVCDARRGLLRVDPDSGLVTAVTNRVEGVPMVFCNNAAIASDGDVWFSDSSTRFGIEQWKDDFVQNTRTGRLLRLRTDGEVEVVLEGLAFANGVALSADESFVAVAETGARTVVRHWLTGERAGRRDFLVEGLPGYPDNIARGSDGLIWVTIASPRDPVVERIQAGPLWLRRQVTRIPERLQPKPKRTVRAQAYDDHGRLVRDVEVETDRYHMATGVREHDGRLWLGSLHEPAVAAFDLGTDG